MDMIIATHAKALVQTAQAPVVLVTRDSAFSHARVPDRTGCD
jgi:polysaccharide pyruvyl transferase WcaK-like protein